MVNTLPHLAIWLMRACAVTPGLPRYIDTGSVTALSSNTYLKQDEWHVLYIIPWSNNTNVPCRVPTGFASSGFAQETAVVKKRRAPPSFVLTGSPCSVDLFFLS
ncbi:hypothetical protein DL546_009836 [Coniochaeta pulveracea]|uniref:Secreted protein n=1 Tax=Coniochaeta pulveracea TaxID=177199 RepID=A0A420YP71_9PEZI|nr:hypothetical protein DL546_009836 [Coniochaeta pulveracea]